MIRLQCVRRLGARWIELRAAEHSLLQTLHFLGSSASPTQAVAERAQSRCRSRCAAVATWDLAFNHLLTWLLSDSVRLPKIDDRISIRYPQKSLRIVNLEDFEELEESEVIEVASSEFAQHKAEDTITDLVNNLDLKSN